MIPKYDLIDDNTGKTIVLADDIMTNAQIDYCADLIKSGKLVASDPVTFWIKINPVLKFSDVCY